MRGCTADGAELTELSSTSHEGCSLRAGQGIHNQWPNTAANHRAHANEEPLNPPDLRRLTGFQQHAQRKEETAAPTETSTSEKKLFSPFFLPLRSFASSNNIRICSHRNYRTLKTPSWAGRKRWFTLCWFLSRGGGGLKSSQRHVWWVGSQSAVLRAVLGSGAALGLDPGRGYPHPRPRKLPHALRTAPPDCPGTKRELRKNKMIKCFTFILTAQFEPNSWYLNY